MPPLRDMVSVSESFIHHLMVCFTFIQYYVNVSLIKKFSLKTSDFILIIIKSYVVDVH